MKAELDKRKSYNRLAIYKPYAKQLEFHQAGKQYRERLLMAANQVGKTISAGAELAMHLTGRYPDWWDGRVFETPIHAWASGVTGESTRDNPQRILYGPLGSPGTGMLPKDAIKDAAPRRGIADALDTMLLRWGGGGDIQAGESQLNFKSNDQGREKWQGPTLHAIWMDEEHDEDIYNEARTRTNVHMGLVMTTFTPLKGMSGVVKRFMIDKPPRTNITSMTIDDAEHYTLEQRAEIVAGYSPYEREARAKGIPQLGSGKVFQLTIEDIKCKAFPIPEHWVQIGGIDFGWDHPSAGIKLVWDRDADCMYVTACHRARQQTPMMFAAAVKSWGHWLPWAWPHDGLQHDKGSGEQLAKQYKAQGLAMLANRATFDDGSNGLEAGIAEMLDRMNTDRLKVFEHLTDWFEEFDIYHRKDGLIVKLNDDLISATRYAIMMKRFAIVQNKIIKPKSMNGSMPRPTGWMS